MIDGRVLILAALPEEGRPLRQTVERWRDVFVATTGDGSRPAGYTSRDMVALLRPQLVVIAGYSAALTRHPRAGDVCLVHELRDEAGRVRRPDPSVLERVRRIGLDEAVLVSARSLPCSAAERARLCEGCSIDQDAPALVDLESFTCAGVAESAGVPWIAVRTVTGSAARGVPRWLDDVRDGNGSVSRGSLALTALLRPYRIPTLLRLAYRAGAGGRALARTVPPLLEAAFSAPTVTAAGNGRAH